MDKPIESISKRLNYALALRHMSQAELSKKTKISTGSLSQYMNDRINPKQDRICIMAKALYVSELWLMGFDVPMERSKEIKINYVDLDPEITDDIRLLVERYKRLDEQKREHILKTLEYMLE